MKNLNIKFIRKMNNQKPNYSPAEVASNYKPKRLGPQYRTSEEISSKYERFLNKGKDPNVEDIHDTPEQNIGQSNRTNLVAGQKLDFDSPASDQRTPLDNRHSAYNYHKSNNKNFLKLSKGEAGKQNLIGPSGRWNNIQTHYETMNNKENFGGDMDDIEEMSEQFDDNSKFVYTSEEDENSGDQYLHDENINQNSNFKNNKPNSPGKVAHQNVDLYSSEDDHQQFVDEDENEYNDHEDDFRVYTVEDATRKIEAETRRMIDESAKKYSSKSSAKSPPKSPSKSPQNKPPLLSNQEEHKNTPVKKEKGKNFNEDHLSKYKVAVVKTNLDSMAFSDIVNYESNDDVVSLTGDRRFKKSNHLNSKLSSNKSSTIGNKPHSALPFYSKAPTGSDHGKVQEIIITNPEKAKDELEFFTQKLNEIKRESDIV